MDFGGTGTQKGVQLKVVLYCCTMVKWRDSNIVVLLSRPYEVEVSRVRKVRWYLVWCKSCSFMRGVCLMDNTLVPTYFHIGLVISDRSIIVVIKIEGISYFRNLLVRNTRSVANILSYCITYRSVHWSAYVAFVRIITILLIINKE